MEIKGKLVRWNDERGFGFIQADELDKDLFIHISALKSMPRKPRVGDVLYFIIATDKDGKDKAYNARIEGLAAKVNHAASFAKPVQSKSTQNKQYAGQRSKRNKKSGSAVQVVVIVLALFGAYKYVTQQKPVVNTPVRSSTLTTPAVVNTPVRLPTKAAPDPEPTRIQIRTPVRAPVRTPVRTPVRAPVIREDFSGYSCQGKQHCGQMTSCKEARFYLKNCPNMKVDGDGDGVPCERQWCKLGVLSR